MLTKAERQSVLGCVLNRCQDDAWTLMAVALMGLAGLRVGEMTGLDWDDVEMFKDGEARLVVGGSHARMVPLGPVARWAVLAGLARRGGGVGALLRPLPSWGAWDALIRPSCGR